MGALLRKQDYTSRFYEVFYDLSSNKALWSMRLCPRCNVIIQKKSGCNSFGCICGHTFDFASAPAIKDLDSRCVEELTSNHDMSQPDAVNRVISAMTVKGLKNYRRVVAMARERQIALDLAEVHEQALLRQDTALAQLEDARRARHDAKKEELLVTQLHMSASEAKVVLQDAKAGDPAAYAKISRARQVRAHEHSKIKIKETDLDCDQGKLGTA